MKDNVWDSRKDMACLFAGTAITRLALARVHDRRLRALTEDRKD
ncbi:MAG TPA: hypothetical protein VLH60_05885 [Sedimentisphaerales bacterium]|nr:hypothetical protein [Sedimentisphaerales bacterium]